MKKNTKKKKNVASLEKKGNPKVEKDNFLELIKRSAQPLKS
jgi:hypothetical protein